MHAPLRVLSGISQDGISRGSGNAVKIRNNSHCRNRASEVGMLIGLRSAKNSRANRGAWIWVGRTPFFRRAWHPVGGVLLLYLSAKIHA